MRTCCQLDTARTENIQHRYSNSTESRQDLLIFSRFFGNFFEGFLQSLLEFCHFPFQPLIALWKQDTMAWTENQQSIKEKWSSIWITSFGAVWTQQNRESKKWRFLSLPTSQFFLLLPSPRPAGKSESSWMQIWFDMNIHILKTMTLLIFGCPFWAADPKGIPQSISLSYQGWISKSYHRFDQSGTFPWVCLTTYSLNLSHSNESVSLTIDLLNLGHSHESQSYHRFALSGTFQWVSVLPRIRSIWVIPMNQLVLP